MSQLVRLEGKHTAQRAHCALWFRRRKAFWNISERKTSSCYGRSLGDMQREVSVQGGQLLLARSPNGEYVRKILESTDHTLVPMHYKQLAGQVWHSPNFKRKKCWEQTCKERNNEHEHTSTKFMFFTDWGKKDHFLHLLERVWNRMQAQHCKWSGRYLYWIEVDQAQSTLGLFFWNSADTAQGTTHCQRHHEPRCWLL